MFASLQLGELHETRKEPADCKTCHAAPGGRQHVALQVLQVLPAACCLLPQPLLDQAGISRDLQQRWWAGSCKVRSPRLFGEVGVWERQ